jgi:hypothetical protein
MKPLTYCTNHLLKTFYPRFSNLLGSVRNSLVKQPLTAALSTAWSSDFLGHVILANRQTGQHVDVNGIRRGVDILLAVGNFSGGTLYLKDVNICIPFLPGALVAFDGTAQRHAIEEFQGERQSHVLFVHWSVCQQENIDTTLPNLTLQDIMDSLAQEEAESAPQRAAPVHTPKTSGKKRKVSLSGEADQCRYNLGPQAKR